MKVLGTLWSTTPNVCLKLSAITQLPIVSLLRSGWRWNDGVIFLLVSILYYLPIMQRWRICIRKHEFTVVMYDGWIFYLNLILRFST